MSVIAPCKDCANRHLACHSNCELYHSWKQEYELNKNGIVTNKLNEKQLNDRRNEAIRRMWHSKNKTK